VKDLRSEALALKECVADLTLESHMLKKSMRGAGRARNEISVPRLAIAQQSAERATSKKLEITRTVEGSHLLTKKTLDMLGIPRTTFYRWHDRYLEGGFDALADPWPRPGSVWNRIPQDRRDDLIAFALAAGAQTTRELAIKYTDEKRYFVSESSTYRMLKSARLITAPDYVVLKAAEGYTDRTTAINEMPLSRM
jgi:hypothetical protein